MEIFKQVIIPKASPAVNPTNLDFSNKQLKMGFEALILHSSILTRSSLFRDGVEHWQQKRIDFCKAYIGKNFPSVDVDDLLTLINVNTKKTIKVQLC